jgi:ferrous iron transport protein B
MDGTLNAADGLHREPAVRVALVGNPNTGKSTLFSALAGVRQRTGNYPGVTVEKKEGRMAIAGQPFVLIDLPGTYSLAPRSPDEMVAVDVLLGRRDDEPPLDMVICIVDASNLERNLYVVSQVLELGLPVVLAVNMVDIAADRGLKLDLARLERQLGVPVVPVQAHRKVGIDKLSDVLAAMRPRAITSGPATHGADAALAGASGSKLLESKPAASGQANSGQASSGQVGNATRGGRASPFPEAFQGEVAALERLEQRAVAPVLPRYLLERLLLDTTGYLENAGLPGVTPELLAEVKSARSRLTLQGLPVPGVEAMSRYQWVAGVLEGVVVRPKHRLVTTGDKVDRVLTHRIWGTLVFVAMMVLMFQTVFWMAEPASMLIDGGKSWLGDQISAVVPEGALRSLLVNGVLEGVGGVLVFLPQIFTLFLFIAVLEDCGYMARAAYLMDRLMSRVGLSGKSFIPLLSSFACAIPGVMATRVIENPKDRLVTMLVAPLMSCSARLPVYTLLVGAFIPDRYYLGGWFGLQGLTMFAMYAIGVVMAVVVAWVLKLTLLRGVTPPFVMELPGYKLPGLGIVLYRMLERGWSFVQRAGTLIFAVSVVVWAAAYYPRDIERVAPELVKRQTDAAVAVARLEAREAEMAGSQTEGSTADESELAAARRELEAADDVLAGAMLRHSYLGRLGQWIEPVVKPLGWDWRIGCAALASFPAREVLVATLGVIYNLGADEDEESESLRETLRSATWDGTTTPLFNVPVALSIMVFFALCAQCASTLAVIKRETNTYRWPAFTFIYMTSLAYIMSLAVYQIGIRCGG